MKITDVTSVPAITRTHARARVRANHRAVTKIRQPKVDRMWYGPLGTNVKVIAGSMSKVERWMLLLIDRVRKAERRGYIDILIRRCGRGCAHGYGSSHHLSLYLAPEANRDSNKYLLIHELAHACNRVSGDRHGPGFYDALYRISKAEGCYRMINEYQNNKAAMRRARQRMEGRAA